MLSIPWYFTHIIEQPSLWGMIYFSVTVISLFWGLYGGTLVDRFNRKHIFIAENSLGAFVLLSVAAYGFFNGGLSSFFVGLVFATTFFTWNIHYPALYAFVQEITDKKDYTRITSYLEIQGQLTSVAAGGIGAILLAGVEGGLFTIPFLNISFTIPFSIKAWSIQQVFLLDGITYLLSLLLILPIHFVPVSKRFTEHLTLTKRFKIGIDFLKQHPLIFVFGNAAYFVFVTTMTVNFYLMPLFVSKYLKASGDVFAKGEMAFAIGAVFSGIFVARVFNKTTNVKGCIIMSCITASTFFIMMFSRDLAVFYLLYLFLGLANSGSRIMRVSYMFKHIPNQVIGRTGSVFQVFNVLFRLTLIGLFSLPFFVENINYAFLLMSVACFIAAAILWTIYKDLVNLKTSN